MSEIIGYAVILAVISGIVFGVGAYRKSGCDAAGGILVGGGAYAKPTCVNPDGSIAMEYYK